MTTKGLPRQYGGRFERDKLVCTPDDKLLQYQFHEGNNKFNIINESMEQYCPNRNIAVSQLKQ